MLNLRRSVFGVLAVLLVGAAGCSSPSQTETPAVVASTPTSLETDSFVIHPQFNDALPFSEGLAAVRIGSEWGFIDKTGSVVINSQFDSARSLSEGLAVASISGRFGFIAR